MIKNIFKVIFFVLLSNAYQVETICQGLRRGSGQNKKAVLRMPRSKNEAKSFGLGFLTAALGATGLIYTIKGGCQNQSDSMKAAWGLAGTLVCGMGSVVYIFNNSPLYCSSDPESPTYRRIKNDCLAHLWTLGAGMGGSIVASGAMGLLFYSKLKRNS